MSLGLRIPVPGLADLTPVDEIFNHLLKSGEVEISPYSGEGCSDPHMSTFLCMGVEKYFGDHSEYYVEVIAGQGLQPTEDHPLGFFHGFDPLHSTVIRSEDELPLCQVVSPLPHEVDGRENFSLVG